MGPGNFFLILAGHENYSQLSSTNTMFEFKFLFYFSKSLGSPGLLLEACIRECLICTFSTLYLQSIDAMVMIWIKQKKRSSSSFM